MKIFAISDLHLSVKDEKPMDIFGGVWANYLEDIKKDWLLKVSSEDIVVLCGDLSWAMKLEEIGEAVDLLKSLPGKKIIVKGNHDYWWKSISSVRSAVAPANCLALQNDAIKIGEYVFCGTRGWSSEENKPLSESDQKIFDREVLRLEMSLKHAKTLMAEGDKLIALMHYPPFNSKQSESKFMSLFEEYGVCDVVYGHLHGKNIYKRLFFVKNNVKYFLSSCDQVENKLVEIEVNE